MSKSLGNVLDPNEVIDRFGADALRFYCFREVSFGQDGNVSAAGFEARYETELANDWGNLASRTLAMIERYRDGVVPEAERRPGAASGDDALEGVDGVVRELLDRAELSQALEAIWSRVRRLNRYVEERRRGSWPRTSRRPSASTGPLQPRRGDPGAGAAAAALHARDERRLLDALAEGERELDAFGARGGGQTIERIRRCSRSSTVRRGAGDRHPLPSRPLRAGRGGAGRGGAPRRGAADAQRRHRRGRRAREAIATAERHEEVLRLRRAPSQRRRRLRRRGRGRGSRSWPPIRASPRSARPGSTTTATAPRATTSAAPSAAQIEIARRVAKPLVIHVRDGGQIDRRRGAGGDLRAAARRGGRGDRDPALLLGPAGAGGGGGRAGLVLLVRRQPHLPERGVAARGGAPRCPTSCCWSRPTPRSSPRSRCAGGRTSRPTSSPPPSGSPRSAGSPTRELEAIVEANAARVFGW